jgi:hypothetical protein
MAIKTIFGECDCCGKIRKLSLVYYQGIETYLCQNCYGKPPDKFHKKKIVSFSVLEIGDD